LQEIDAVMKHKRTLEAFDSEGQRYSIQEYVTIIPMGTLDDPNATAEGLKAYRTADGGAVNRRGENEFEIVATGMRVQVPNPKPIAD
jgi:hypothetical protein